MKALLAIAFASMPASCAMSSVTFDESDRGRYSDRCSRVTDFVSAPLDDHGFRFVHFYWPSPGGDSIAFYASMVNDPGDEHSSLFYKGDDKIGGIGQITHYRFIPEVGEFLANCLEWSGRFIRKRRVATSDDGFLAEFSAMYVERRTARYVIMDTRSQTLGLLVSDKFKDDELRAELRIRMDELFDEPS